ncbi:MAG: ribbon-helix-helix protein, CopG family [Spirochaetales bacterium]
MTSSLHRTSFALDHATVERLQRLARRWNVSQAEVVRRAVRAAADQADAEGESVAERLDRYRTANGLGSEEADAYLSRVREERADWTRDHDSP